PLKYPNVYRHLGINPPRGIILYGPPGSGKTHLARAVANEVDARFYYINGPDVIGTYTGETEANLRRMFSEASHHAPSIIFIDELDAMAPKRGETGAHADTRAVTQLLSLMDGLTRSSSSPPPTALMRWMPLSAGPAVSTARYSSARPTSRGGAKSSKCIPARCR